MIRLSLSAHSDRHLATCTVVTSLERFTAAGFTHPGNPESLFDLPLYRHYLFQQLRNPHSTARKDAMHILDLHRRGYEVLLRLHANAMHGDVLVAALRWLETTCPPAPQRQRTPEPVLTNVPAQMAYAPDSSWSETDDLDARRFVWVTGRQGDITRLGYIWDTEGVLTALVPGYGLVKLGRVRRSRRQRGRWGWMTVPQAVNYWQAHAEGPVITPRCHLARVAVDGRVADIFSHLVSRQRRAETVATDGDDRYDPWALAPDPAQEDIDEAQRRNEEALLETETQAFLALYQGPQAFDWRQLQPCAYQGEHVRPVVKTKADGSRWVLSPERQAKGMLHLYTPLP